MKKLIGLPLIILAAPQVAMLAAYFLVRAVIGDSEALRVAYADGASASVVIGLLGALSGLFGEWIPDYERRQARLEEERQEEARRLDAEIGIPRIPMSRR